MTQTTGHYTHVDGRPVVRFERTFPHPVDAVWDAITDPERLAEWFPTTVEFTKLETGAPIAFRFAEDRYPAMEGEVLEVAPRERLAFTWGDDRLTFELAPHESGSACRLSLSVVLDTEDKAARDSAGWESCLDTLAVIVAGENPERPVPSDRWKDYYKEYQRLGLPARAEIPS